MSMNGGAVRITSNSAIIASGKPIRMYGASLQSGVTAGTAIFYDGTSTSGTKILDVEGAASRTIAIPDIPAEGILFPNGLFVDVSNANTTAVTVFAELVSNK